ncbi:hypothetical protein [Streptomyces sp. NBC_00459]|uniref:hypothetical protein n=1 Tax=Streptomyces sp. NBC_00459 TaxID=2975749 RepID=UPI003FA6F4E6
MESLFDRSSSPCGPSSSTTSPAYPPPAPVTAVGAARRPALGVRALIYRLERIRTLTGNDPADRADRHTLRTALIGARLLDRPTRPL